MDCSLSGLSSVEYASRSKKSQFRPRMGCRIALDSSDLETLSLSGTKNAGVPCEQPIVYRDLWRNSQSCP